MRISDLDLNALTLQIREMKRVQGVRIMRRVPLAGPLVAILKAWLANHPGGPLFFAASEHVHRSRS